MYKIVHSNKFDKDVKRCHFRGLDMELLIVIIDTLRDNGKLPSKNKPHKLKDNYIHHWEAHIKPDWLIV